ncbi:MAG: transposase [Bryobacteraceae bacterium]
MTYLLTFASYGTRLHGDAKGSFDRRQGPVHENAAWESFERSLLREHPFELDADRRVIVLEAIQEVAAYRNWRLVAVHVRSTHVHAIVDTDTTPPKAIGDFKAYASRRLAQRGNGLDRQCRWARFGNFSLLRDRKALASAISYVLEQQGEPMATFLDPAWAA